MSQAETLEELQQNILDAYRMMVEAEYEPACSDAKTIELGVDEPSSFAFLLMSDQ